MRGCEDEQMWRWEDVKMRGCKDEKMWRWEDVKMRGCKDETMWRWEDVKMRCEDERMWRWDVKMRCEDEMWRWEDVLQTPTIGRTLRSDALGKKPLWRWTVMNFYREPSCFKIELEICSTCNSLSFVVLLICCLTWKQQNRKWKEHDINNYQMLPVINCLEATWHIFPATKQWPRLQLQCLTDLRGSSRINWWIFPPSVSRDTNWNNRCSMQPGHVRDLTETCIISINWQKWGDFFTAKMCKGTIGWFKNVQNNSTYPPCSAQKSEQNIKVFL